MAKFDPEMAKDDFVSEVGSKVGKSSSEDFSDDYAPEQPDPETAKPKPSDDKESEVDLRKFAVSSNATDFGDKQDDESKYEPGFSFQTVQMSNPSSKPAAKLLGNKIRIPWILHAAYEGDNWDKLVSKHGTETEAMKHSQWHQMDSDSRDLWSNSPAGLKAIKTYLAKNPEQKYASMESKSASESRDRASRVKSLREGAFGLTAQPQTPEGFSKTGFLPTGKKIDLADVPNVKREDLARWQGEYDPTPDLSVTKRIYPKSPLKLTDGSHHTSLNNLVEGLVRAHTTGSSQQGEIAQVSNPLRASSPIAKAATSAKESLTASAMADGLGMKDEANRHYANAVSHVMNLARLVHGERLNRGEAVGAVPEGLMEAGQHLTGYQRAAK